MWLEEGGDQVAFRFISLGVGLGVFSIVPGTWSLARSLPSGPLDREPIERWIEQRAREGEECRFRCRPDLVESVGPTDSVSYHV